MARGFVTVLAAALTFTNGQEHVVLTLSVDPRDLEDVLAEDLLHHGNGAHVYDGVDLAPLIVRGRELRAADDAEDEAAHPPPTPPFKLPNGDLNGADPDPLPPAPVAASPIVSQVVTAPPGPSASSTSAPASVLPPPAPSAPTTT